MRIIDLSAPIATLEDGRIVDVSHQSFCSYEMFGPGHDEECECLDFEEQGSAGELTADELDTVRRGWATKKAATLEWLRNN
jgi:hypothetical protein